MKECSISMDKMCKISVGMLNRGPLELQLRARYVRCFTAPRCLRSSPRPLAPPVRCHSNGRAVERCQCRRSDSSRRPSYWESWGGVKDGLYTAEIFRNYLILFRYNFIQFRGHLMWLKCDLIRIRYLLISWISHFSIAWVLDSSMTSFDAETDLKPIWLIFKI